MASKGSGARLAVLGLIVLVLAGVLAFVKMRGGTGGGPDVQAMVLNGELLGKTMAEATAALGVEPQIIPNEPTDSPSTKNALFVVAHTDPAKTVRVRVREQAGKLTVTELVDEQNKPLPIDFGDGR
jgi:hypothetical protein